jgi:hypothetical protein
LRVENDGPLPARRVRPPSEQNSIIEFIEELRTLPTACRPVATHAITHDTERFIRGWQAYITSAINMDKPPHWQAVWFWRGYIGLIFVAVIAAAYFGSR